MNTPGQLSRRTFLKGLGAATTLPWLDSPAAVSERPATSAKHTVLTANIRVALPEDEAAGKGWKQRRKLCVEVIDSRRPDIICLQEVLREQVVDLRADWPGLAELGFEGPEMDAHVAGYHGIAKNPIFYSRERYELTAAGGFWLSDTPHLPGSLAWGAARARHVNWVRLKARESGREFRVLNTHLDHQSQAARERQMAMVLGDGACYPADFPQLLAGDLNVDASNPVRDLVRKAGWEDTYTAMHGENESGFTYHNFQGPAFTRKAGSPQTGRIDFIFARGALRAVDAEIIRDSRAGHFPSDHYFVSTQVIFT